MKRLHILQVAAAVGFGGVCSLVPGPDLGAQTKDEECAHELLLSYYPSHFVRETLGRFSVPKEKHDAIVEELERLDKEVVPTVERQAAAMNPNPLRDPKLRNQAIKIFRETLYDLFASVMRAYGITEEEQIHQMLDAIQQQKAEHFARCMEKYQPDPQPRRFNRENREEEPFED